MQRQIEDQDAVHAGWLARWSEAVYVGLKIAEVGEALDWCPTLMDFKGSGLGSGVESWALEMRRLRFQSE